MLFRKINHRIFFCGIHIFILKSLMRFITFGFCLFGCFARAASLSNYDWKYQIPCDIIYLIRYKFFALCLHRFPHQPTHSYIMLKGPFLFTFQYLKMHLIFFSIFFFSFFVSFFLSFLFVLIKRLANIFRN